MATDIAARGIHVDAVSHVVNYDLPNVPESYVHRIGRTARAGSAGVAISFCNGEERAFLRDIEKLTRQSIPAAPLPAGIEAGVERAAPDRAPKRHGNQPKRRQNANAGHQAQRGRASRHSDGRQRQRGGGGLDPATGLPAFLTRTASRGKRVRDHAEA